MNRPLTMAFSYLENQSSPYRLDVSAYVQPIGAALVFKIGKGHGQWTVHLQIFL